MLFIRRRILVQKRQLFYYDVDRFDNPGFFPDQSYAKGNKADSSPGTLPEAG